MFEMSKIIGWVSRFYRREENCPQNSGGISGEVIGFQGELIVFFLKARKDTNIIFSQYFSQKNV